MAGPLLLGLPWLWGVIAGALTSLFTYFLQYFGRRFAERAVIVASFVALTGAFWLAAWSIVSTIVIVLPDGFELGYSAIVPDNAPLCVGACFAARIARSTYDWQKRVIFASAGE